jgi:hypothetical protein
MQPTENEQTKEDFATSKRTVQIHQAQRNNKRVLDDGRDSEVHEDT